MVDQIMPAECPTLDEPLRFDWQQGWCPTPYLEAIFDLYGEPQLFYLDVETNFAGTALEQQSVYSKMLLHDAVILGAGCRIGTGTTDLAQQIQLNVTHDSTGLTWNVSDPLDRAPLTAIAGVPTEGMPIIPLPDAFFLPRRTRLVHRWRNNFAGVGGAATGGSITWIGIQFFKEKFKGARPQWLTLKDGRKIRLGSRIPWYATIGLGTESVNSGVPSFALSGAAGSERRYTHFTQPHYRDVEVHGIHANFFQQAEVSLTPNLVFMRLYDFGEGPMWQLKQSSISEIADDLTAAYPVMPFTRPYKLSAGHQLEIEVQNLTGANISQPLLTMVGVQICQ